MFHKSNVIDSRLNQWAMMSGRDLHDNCTMGLSIGYKYSTNHNQYYLIL